MGPWATGRLVQQAGSRRAKRPHVEWWRASQTHVRGRPWRLKIWWQRAKLRHRRSMVGWWWGNPRAGGAKIRWQQARPRHVAMRLQKRRSQKGRRATRVGRQCTHPRPKRMPQGKRRWAHVRSRMVQRPAARHHDWRPLQVQKGTQRHTRVSLRALVGAGAGAGAL